MEYNVHCIEHWITEQAASALNWDFIRCNVSLCWVASIFVSHWLVHLASFVGAASLHIVNICLKFIYSWCTFDTVVWGKVSTPEVDCSIFLVQQTCNSDTISTYYMAYISIWALLYGWIAKFCVDYTLVFLFTLLSMFMTC